MATLKNNKLLPVYLTVGPDTLKRTEAHKRMRARFEADPNFTFNYSKFDGESAAAEDIVAAANSLPFVSEYRLVEVVNLDKLHAREPDRKKLAEYIKNPSGSTVMLLDAETLAKNTLLYKAISGVGKQAIIDCSQKKTYELVALVKNLAKGYGVNFTEAAARALIDLVGSDTTTINSHVKRITSVHMSAGSVGVEEVKGVVARTAELKPWDFTNAFGARDLSKCLTYMQSDKLPSPYVLLPMCVNTLREIICVQSLSARGERGRLIAELSEFRGRRVQEFQVKDHGAWARLWNTRALCSAISAACDAEFKMKTGTAPDVAFRDWVVATLT